VRDTAAVELPEAPASACVSEAGFAAQPLRWALPPTDADPVAAPRLVDMDGDGRLDQLVVQDASAPAVGASSWRVHRNTGAGFGDGEDWSLPSIPGVDRLTATVLDRCAGGGPLVARVADVTADQRADLIVTRGCGEADDGWQVYPAEASGFAAQPTPWRAPSPGDQEETPDLAAGAARCADGGDVPYTFASLTGDGRPDLLAYRGCGDAGWSVQAGSERGYQPATGWRTPSELAGGRAVAPPAGVVDGRIVNTCRWQQGASFLADLTGAGRVDLWVTDACDAGDVGSARWLRFENEGDGFAATPADWPLPAPPRPDAFDRDAGERGCMQAGSSRAREDLLVGVGWRYHLRDMTADGRPDLVVTERCGAAPDRWAVHANTGAGFAAEGADWCLPEAAVSDGAVATAGPAERRCEDGSRPTYETLELTGDGCPDLVLRGSCEDPSVGRTHWLVFPGVCAGEAP